MKRTIEEIVLSEKLEKEQDRDNQSLHSKTKHIHGHGIGIYSIMNKLT